MKNYYEKICTLCYHGQTLCLVFVHFWLAFSSFKIEMKCVRRSHAGHTPTFILLIMVGMGWALVWSQIRWNWLKLMVAVTHGQDCINNQSFEATLSIHVTTHVHKNQGAKSSIKSTSPIQEEDRGSTKMHTAPLILFRSCSIFKGGMECTKDKKEPIKSNIAEKYFSNHHFKMVVDVKFLPFINVRFEF